MNLTLIERKKILEQLLNNNDSDFLRFSDHILGSGRKMFSKCCTLGLEGIISKEINSTYSESRNKSWLKIKCTKKQEFIIGGFLKSKQRDYFQSLLIGTFNKNKELVYHGRVGTGFTNNSLKMIYTLLAKHITKTNPFTSVPPQSKNVVWIKPHIVAEIAFTEWTATKTLRHPSFKGIRSDKSISSIKKEIEMPISKISNTSPNKTQTIILPFELSHPDKIVYPEDKITKRQVAEYYHAIQDWILPYIAFRPLTLVRCPNDYKRCFFQKHINNKSLPGIYAINIKDKEGMNEYFYIKDAQGLMSLSQIGALELHPWNSRKDNIEYPDILIFDLDPSPELAWSKVVAAALDVKNVLKAFHLKSFIKTTGGKGLHIVVPIIPEHSYSDVKQFSKMLVDYLVENNSEKYVGTITKSKRTNKIFIDYLRNQRGATSIAPYSTRARKHAPVATPLTWDELTNDIRDTYFTIQNISKRLYSIKQDPWKNFLTTKQSLNIKKILK